MTKLSENHFHLDQINPLDGISATQALGGESVEMLVKGTFTSVDDEFYGYVDSVWRHVIGKHLSADAIFYASHLKRIYRRFPKERVLVMLYDDLAADSLQFVQRLFEFLEVDSLFEPAGLGTIVGFPGTAGATIPKRAISRGGCHRNCERRLAACSMRI